MTLFFAAPLAFYYSCLSEQTITMEEKLKNVEALTRMTHDNAMCVATACFYAVVVERLFRNAHRNVITADRSEYTDILSTPEGRKKYTHTHTHTHTHTYSHFFVREFTVLYISGFPFIFSSPTITHNLFIYSFEINLYFSTILKISERVYFCGNGYGKTFWSKRKLTLEET
jgi:hypothetical protein